jgi:hypothetical protein
LYFLIGIEFEFELALVDKIHIEREILIRRTYHNDIQMGLRIYGEQF